MDIDKLVTRYKQFGGFRQVWQYAKLGILPVVIRGVRCLFKRQSFKAIYPDYLKIVEPFLDERFHVLGRATAKLSVKFQNPSKLISTRASESDIVVLASGN